MKKLGRPIKWTAERCKEEADALLEYVKVKKPIPFLKDFCSSRGYSSQAVSEYLSKDQYFRHALGIYRDKIESIIIDGAITNKFNAYFAFNMLKNCCGWRDKQEHMHNGDINIKNLLSDDESSNSRSRYAESSN